MLNQVNIKLLGDVVSSHEVWVSASESGTPGLKVIKLFSCSTQLRLKFILLINVKMPTFVGILTSISRIKLQALAI